MFSRVVARSASFALLFLLIASTGTAQDAVSRYEFGPRGSSDGIGKFYLGREISFVMGHRGADWLERPERLEEEQPDQVVSNMGLEPHHVVADIGAGTGYFSFRLAALVPDGKVLAVDIQPEMLQLIEQRQQREGVDNIEGVLGQIDNPNLMPETVDVALMVDAYHEFSHPYEMIAGLYQALKPGGRIFLLEYRAEDPDVPILPLHKMTQEQAIKEMAVFNLQWTETLDFLPWQHMMVFTKAE